MQPPVWLRNRRSRHAGPGSSRRSSCSGQCSAPAAPAGLPWPACCLHSRNPTGQASYVRCRLPERHPDQSRYLCHSRVTVFHLQWYYASPTEGDCTAVHACAGWASTCRAITLGVPSPRTLLDASCAHQDHRTWHSRPTSLDASLAHRGCRGRQLCPPHRSVWDAAHAPPVPPS